MKSTNKNLLNFLGLANKAGKIILGNNANKKNLLKLHLIVLASDASLKTKEFFIKKGKEHNLPVKVFVDSETLGSALGFSPVTVIGIKDLSFAEAFLKLINAGKEVNSNGGDLNG